jgi:rubrerythrin
MEAIEKKNVPGIDRWRTKGGGVYDAFTMTREDPAFGNFLWFVARRRIQEEAESYEALAAIAIGRSVKEFFSKMADVKTREAEKLEENAQTDCLVAEGEESTPQSPPERNSRGSEVISSMEEACRLALRFEVANYCLHIHLAELEENAATRRLFLFLVQIHKANLQFIEKTLQEATGTKY